MKMEISFSLQQKLQQLRRASLYTDSPPNLIARQKVVGPPAGEVTHGVCIYSTDHETTIFFIPSPPIICERHICKIPLS